MVFQPEEYFSYKTPPRTNFARRIVTSPGRFGLESPDSGYGSLEESDNVHSPCPKLRSGNICGLDGQQASHLARDGNTLTDERRRHRPRSPIPPALKGTPYARSHAHRPTQNRENIPNRPFFSKLHKNSLCPAPDRFVPLRSKHSASERFQTTKPLLSLSGPEKLLRRDFVCRDPFEPRASSTSLPTTAPSVPHGQQGLLDFVGRLG